MDNHIRLRSDRLQSLRKQRGWSQRYLGELCRIADTQIGKYEAGLIDPSSTYLARLAEQLQVSTDYLLGLTDEMRGHYEDQALNEDEQAMVNRYRREGWEGVIHLGAERLAK